MPVALTRKAHIAVLAVAMTAPMAGTAGAQVFCTKPITPFCIDQATTYADESSRADCRAQVEEFVAKTAAYADCLKVQGKEAESEAETLRGRFECKLRGEQDCPEVKIGS